MGDFSEKVYAVVAQIPVGKVASYGTVARLIGSPRSARYVGFALRNNPAPGSGFEHIPCHRVVFKDGSLCEGFIFGGPEVQYKLLQGEGVTFVDNNRVDMEACEWSGAGFSLNTSTPTAQVSSSDAEAAAQNEASFDESTVQKAPQSMEVAANISPSENEPTAPPADFDWKAELGE